jgi:hypothetical protein
LHRLTPSSPAPASEASWPMRPARNCPVAAEHSAPSDATQPARTARLAKIRLFASTRLPLWLRSGVCEGSFLEEALRSGTGNHNVGQSVISGAPPKGFRICAELCAPPVPTLLRSYPPTSPTDATRPAPNHLDLLCCLAIGRLCEHVASDWLPKPWQLLRSGCTSRATTG